MSDTNKEAKETIENLEEVTGAGCKGGCCNCGKGKPHGHHGPHKKQPEQKTPAEPAIAPAPPAPETTNS